MKHRGLGPGAEIFGKVIPAGTPAEVRAFVNGATKETLGVDMWKTQLGDIMTGYLNQAGRTIANARANRYVQGAGLLSPAVQEVSKEIAPNGAKVAKAAEGIAAAGGKRATLQDALSALRESQAAAGD
jgi:hypothetical protein